MKEIQTESLSKEQIKELCEQLRKETGMGLMDCKSALGKNIFNIELAKDYLNSNSWKRGKLIDYR